MSLNERELKLLCGFAALLAGGAVVRLVATRAPALTPGVTLSAPDTTLVPETFPGASALDSLFTDGRLDVNAAGPEHLAMLPGIGPALAARMVEVRRSRGRFAAPEDLLMVKGIGPKTLERLRPHIVVE
jgi:competence protein ComEA